MKRISCLIIFLLLSMILYAETIYLKDGSVVSGSIENQTENELVVNTEYGQLRIDKTDIEKILYKSDLEEEVIRDNAIFTRPLALVFSIISGSVDFVFEGQTAVSKKIAINAISEIGTVDGIFFSGLNLGPQFNLTGEYLDGLYFGLFPGIAYLTNTSENALLLTGMIELGYQAISKSGFSWGSYIGCSYFIQQVNFLFGIKIGYSYHPKRMK